MSIWGTSTDSKRGRSGTRRGDGDRAGRQSGKCRVGRHLVIADAVPSRPAGQQHQVLPLVVPVRRRGEPDADQGNGHPPLPDHHGFRLDHHDPSEPGDVRAAAGVRPVQSRGNDEPFCHPRSDIAVDRYQRSARPALRVFRQHRIVDAGQEWAVHLDPRIVRRRREVRTVQQPAQQLDDRRSAERSGRSGGLYLYPAADRWTAEHLYQCADVQYYRSRRLTFQVLVDNRPTVAQLPGVSTPLGSTATDPCGVLHYSSGSDNVEIDYVAFQPGNFVDWSLTVSRGISGVVAEIVPPAPATGTSAGSPGSPVPFNNSASALLGPCLQAAFAVNLYCRARITNGYGQQSQYDSSQTIAFALLHP